MDGLTIFLIILALILLGTTIAFLVLWITKKNSQAEVKKELDITGLTVKLTSNTSVTATWTAVGNSGDQVIMYADTKQVNFDAEGKPEDSTKDLISSGAPVNGSVGTVSISNLVVATNYFIYVVVINPNIKGANVEPFSVFTQTTSPINTEMSISELDIPGAIVLNSDNTVNYVRNTTIKDTTDLWLYTTDFKLQNSGTGNPILYNNNGTLAAADVSASVINSSNSQWVYGSNGDNKWCLKSTPTTCFSLDNGTSTTIPIQVVSNSKSKWQNNTLPTAF